MGRRFDPKHWPQTARTMWNNRRTRRMIVHLGPGTVTDQDGFESEEEGVIGRVDVQPKKRRRG